MISFVGLSIAIFIFKKMPTRHNLVVIRKNIGTWYLIYFFIMFFFRSIIYNMLYVRGRNIT